MNSETLTRSLREHAVSKGIAIIGFTNANPVECLPWSVGAQPGRYTPCNETKIADWVYDPRIVLEDANSVIIAGMYMYGFEKIIPSTPGTPRGKIGPWTRAYWEASQYAANVIINFLKDKGYNAVFTNCLPYRTLAVKAGIGNIGKNGFVYTKEYGSYLRLTCVVTDAILDWVDNGTVSENDCGNCEICIKSCPTGALKGPGQYDYDMCLHQWQQGKGIHGTNIPREDREKTENYLMRTGKCIEVCPRNAALKPRGPFPFEVEDKPDSPELIPLVLADEEEYKRRLPFHTYKYGVENIRRDAVIALGNIGDPAAVPVLIEALNKMPLRIRALSAWSLGKIGGREAYNALLAAKKAEKEKEVLEEIEAAINMILKNDNVK